MSRNGVTFSVEEITPEIAREMLTHNTHNRNPKKNVIVQITEDILADKFGFTGDAIKFSKSGQLLDGQNRLYAVIAANKSITVLVIRGLPEEAQEVMDQGARRSLPDILKLRGEKHSDSLATATRALYAYRRVREPYPPSLSIQPSTRQLLAELEEFPELRRSAAFTDQKKSAVSHIIAPSAIGVFHLLLHRVDADDAGDFFRQLLGEEGMDTGNPVHMLRERFIKHAVRGVGKLDELTKRDFIVQTWNAWYTGQPLRVLRWRGDQEFHQIEGMDEAIFVKAVRSKPR